MLRKTFVRMVAVALLAIAGTADGHDHENGRDTKWVATWITAPQNTFKGVGSTQTAALVNFAFPFTAPALPQANDGSITTPGNNDRFLNWMSRRLHAAYGQHVSVVNAGIGGDTAAIPIPPQTRPLLEVLPERFDRDVLGASGVTDVLFYAGTNDFGDSIPSRQSIASLQSMVAKLHARGINAIGSTLITNVGQAGTSAATYTAHNDINQFILAPGNFDTVADFYNATRDPADSNFLTTKLQLQYATHSDPTGTPDWLHLGRAGALAEADTLDIGFFRPTRHH